MGETDTRPLGGMGAAEARQQQRQHIFVVNGAADFLDIARELLQSESYNVTTTNFVPETFEQVQVLNPDLVIIDLAVRVQAGWDLLERLHAETLTHGIPVIVVSADVRMLEEAQANSARYGGQRFLEKPFDLDELLACVQDLIGTA